MKRLSTALAPTLMTGALLGIGMASQAQSNLIAVVGDVPRDVSKGQTFTLEIRATQNAAEAGTTTTQFVFFTNRPDEITVTYERAAGLNPSLANNEFSPKTTTIASGDYAGTQTMFSTTYGFQPARTLAPGTLLGTYTVTINSDAGGIVDFGLAQAGTGSGASFQYRGGLIETPLTNTFRTFQTTSNPNLTTTDLAGGNLEGRTGGFRVAVVPGPSSLAVFALGGFAPAVALLRRRRAAK
jgi:hypothetical protein